jgi:hypothetical protein
LPVPLFHSRGRAGELRHLRRSADFERLQKLGSDLDQVNPYGGFMRGLVQPFAVIVMRVLLWIKRTTQLNYGWVLVLFGVIIRLALWPLNRARCGRASGCSAAARAAGDCRSGIATIRASSRKRS